MRFGFLSRGSHLSANQTKRKFLIRPITTTHHDEAFGCCCPCLTSNSRNKRSKDSSRTRRKTTIVPSRINHHVDDFNGGDISSNTTRMLVQMDSDGGSVLVCRKCGEKIKNLDSVEAHNISEHSVIELEEDSSRQIIETICGGTSLPNSENTPLGQIDSVLKVQNTPKTLASFEEHRETVKIKAEKLSTRNHPRCLADGNELLRFHGTTVACSLGNTKNSSCSLCTLEHCGLCQILRHGFSAKKEFKGSLGVYTNSTSGKAIDSIRPTSMEARKCVVVCRVIAGNVFSPVDEIQEEVVDSLAEKINGYSDSDVEELYVLSPKAVLPCFLVIYNNTQEIVKVRRVHSSLRQLFDMKVLEFPYS